MSKIGERIRHIREIKGLSQAELARRIGVTRGTVNFWESGATKTLKHENLMAVAKALGVSAEWLTVDSKGAPKIGQDEAALSRYDAASIEDWEALGDSSEYAPIPYLDVELAAGFGAHEMSNEERSKLIFRKDFLRKHNVSPKDARLVDIIGTSMEPRLHDGDTVAINTADKSVRDGKIYAIIHNGMLRIKRLYVTPDGGLRLRSDNVEEYPEEVLSKDEAEQTVQVIGRVFWVAASL